MRFESLSWVKWMHYSTSPQ